jgi:hypothetical protein
MKGKSIAITPLGPLGMAVAGTIVLTLSMPALLILHVSRVVLTAAIQEIAENQLMIIVQI